MTTKNSALQVAVFFCRQLDPDQDRHRRTLEKEMGSRIKFYPLPCGGRIEALHFLRALEAGADLVYLLTCPEGACRYQQGNRRAKKRVAYARKLIQEIGLEPERVEWVETALPLPKRIDGLVRELLDREAMLSVSPLRNR